MEKNKYTTYLLDKWKLRGSISDPCSYNPLTDGTWVM